MVRYLDEDGLRHYHGKITGVIGEVKQAATEALAAHTVGVATNVKLGHVKACKSYTAESKFPGGTDGGTSGATVTLNSITDVAGRYYGVEVDSKGKMFVNVPWASKPGTAGTADVANKVVNPLKLYINSEPKWSFDGSAAQNLKFINGSNTVVEYTSAGEIKINNTYSYSHPGTHDWSIITGVPIAGDLRGVAKTFKKYTSAVASPTYAAGATAPKVEALSATPSRYYGVESDSDGRLFVNVPWANTVYTHPTGNGNTHIPSGGAANQVLVYGGAAGTAKWADAAPKATQVSNGLNLKVNGGSNLWGYNGSANKIIDITQGSFITVVGNADGKVTISQPEDAHDSRYYKKGEVYTKTEVDSAINNKIAASDAMIYKGTIGSTDVTPTVTALPANSLTGHTYKVVTRGTYAGHVCEVGDMLISLKKNAAPTVKDDWSCIQTNIDGVVVGPTASTPNCIPLFNDASGKVIKNSVYSNANLVQNFSVSGATVTLTTCDGKGQAVTVNNVANAGYATSAGSADKVTNALTIKAGGAVVNTFNGAGVVDVNFTGDDTILVSKSAEGTIKYSHSADPGYKHIPANGTSGQYLKFKASGEATWGNIQWSEVSSRPGIATHTTAGLIKPWKSYTAAATGVTEVAGGGTAPKINAISTAAGHYFAVESDSAGHLFVNIPPIDNGFIDGLF